MTIVAGRVCEWVCVRRCDECSVRIVISDNSVINTFVHLQVNLQSWQFNFKNVVKYWQLTKCLLGSAALQHRDYVIA